MNGYHVLNKPLSSLLRTVFEFIKNFAIGFPSSQLYLLQQKGCKFHEICSLFAYSRYTISDTNQEIKSICQEPIVFLLKK